MISFTVETQPPFYWKSVTWCFVLLAALCCCNGLPHQKTVEMAEPLQAASESSTMPDTTVQLETTAVDLGPLLDAGDNAVVTLVTGDTRLAIHWAVLEAGSPVLAAMFPPDTLNASGREANIPGVEGPVLRQLVEFFYTGRATELPRMAPQLLAAADIYGVTALKDSAEQHVTKHLSVENAAATAVLAQRYGNDSLRLAAIDFIRDHLEVLATQGWAEAVIDHRDEIVQITRLLTPAKKSTTTIRDRTATPTDTLADPTTAVSSLTTSAAPAALTDVAQPHDDHSQTTTTVPLPTAGLHTPLPHSTFITRLHTTAVSTANTPTTTAAATPATTTMASTTADSTTTPATTTVASTTADSTTTPTAAATTTATPTATAWLHSIHSQTTATAPLSTGGSHTPLPDNTAAPNLWNLSDKEKGSRLIQAAQNGTAQDLRALIAAGADVQARDEDGLTVLHWAAANGHVEATQSLLQAGADVDARDSGQWTPLHRAVAFGHLGVVRLLLEASADPNARDGDGGTPLHWAAYWGQAETAVALLQAGADKGARDADGQTALDLARVGNHLHLIPVLQ